jgi:hypothetical protein
LLNGLFEHPADVFSSCATCKPSNFWRATIFFP